MTMIKSEIIANIAKQLAEMPEKNIVRGVNQLLEQMSDALAGGDRIEIRGFGSFSLHYRAPRNAHNPRTGEKLQTAGKYSPHFKPSKILRQKVDKAKQLHPIIEASTHIDETDPDLD